MSTQGTDDERQHALAVFKTKLMESREWEAKLKALRQEIKGLQKDFDHTEDNIKALQSVGQIIGEVLKQLDDERCKPRLVKRKHCGNVLIIHVQSLSRLLPVLDMSSAADRKSTRPS